MHGTGLLCSNQGFEMQSLVLKLQHLYWNQGHAQHLPTKNSNIVLLSGIKKKNKIFHWSQIRDKFAIVFNTQNYQLCDLILLRTNGPQVLLWRPLGIENQTAAHGAHVKLKSGSYMSFNHKLLPCGFFFIPKCIERLILFKLYYKIQFLITPVNFYYLKVRIIQHSNLSNN